MDNPNITINGTKARIDEAGHEPLNFEGATMVPLRGIIELLGGSVDYNTETNTARVIHGENVTDFILGSTAAFINGDPVKLGAAPAILNGSLYVPVRALADMIGAELAWNGETREATLTYEGEEIDSGALIPPIELTPEPGAYVPADIGFGSIGTFTTSDIYGNSVNETLFNGKPITFINYWASWCGPCMEELPEFAGLVEKYGEKVKFVSIISDFTDDPAYITGLCEEYMPYFTHLLDLSDELYYALDSGYVPTSIIVDSAGNMLCDMIVGAYGSEYAQFIDYALAVVGAL